MHITKDRLERVECGNHSYIPAKFAQRHRLLKLKQPDGSWDDGWIVEQVWGRLTHRELPDTNKAIRIHLKLTGDALPRKSHS